MSWLWKSDTSSPASFEKVLSKLSSQITTATVSLESTRARSRRIKALWTLYTTLTYLLYTLVIVLVLGPQKWGIPHYSGLLGAPLVIYLVRKGVTLLFDWRIARQQSYLNTLQKQRETKISDLKRATKYDSTQELLQKYGGAPKQTTSKPSQPSQGTKRKINSPQQGSGPSRTGIAPPPTANIPGRIVGPSPTTPQRGPNPLNSVRHGSPQSTLHGQSASPISPDEPGFAPNAFSNPIPPTMSVYEQPSHWYDRILDVLLGEDETLAKNRLALICSNCRLVNGQAPPGVKTLEELGKWRCASCGSWNGVETEATKVVKQMAEKKDEEGDWLKLSHEMDIEKDRAASKSPTMSTAEEIASAEKQATESGEDEDENDTPDDAPDEVDKKKEESISLDDTPVSKSLRKRKAKK